MYAPSFITMLHLFLCSILSIFSSVQPFICIEKDTILPYFLEDIVVVSEKYSSPIKNADTRTIKLDMEYMHHLPKMLGNADPLRYAQMLPGIQTSSEYDSGIHIYGNDNSHNVISLEAVPIYNPSHLLGLFSVFNSAHFSRMTVTKSATASDGYSRIGGIINMELHDEVPEKFNGEFSLGLMSSQGTAKIPIGKKAAVFTSLRLSYLNLLYGSLLRLDDASLLYSFGDVNVTYFQKIKENQTLHIDFYTGIDNAKLQDPGTNLYFDTNAKWGNMIGAAHWNYKFNGGNTKHSLYFTGFRNNINLKGSYNLQVPSEIYDFGYRSESTYKNWKCGASIINHNITPQVPLFDNQNIHNSNNVNIQNVWEGALSAGYSGRFFSDFYYDVALKGDVYTDFRDYCYSALNPFVRFGFEKRKFGKMEFLYSTQHQYLLNCGFTSLGMPVEFWIGADSDYKPQYSHNFQLAYKRDLFNGKYDISVEAYYKRLYNQVEYKGSPLDILNKQYSLNKVIICGDGYNYGANVMINKLTGKLTGWVAYSFGRALRRFDVYGNKWFPSNHERIHELNIVATYKVGKRIDVGGTFSYASGAPFTSVKYFYFMNGNVLTEFGEHNANRLKDYMRLDLSVNYDIIKNEERTFGANLSLYNALCRKNELYYGLRFYDDASFKFRRYAFFTTILPSVSFYYKF